MGDETDEIDSYIEAKINKKLQNYTSPGEDISNVSISEIKKVADAGKSLKDAFQSPFERTVIEVVGSKLVDQIIPMMNPQQRGSSFLDSGFMISMGGKVGESIPAILDVFVRHFGKEKAESMISNLQNSLMSTKSDDKKMPEQNINDAILSLDPDNPSHLHQYMSFRNINDPKIARKSLISEKESIFNTLKNSSSVQNANIMESNSFDNQTNINSTFISTLEKSINEQNQILRELIKARQEDKVSISTLTSELKDLKTKVYNVPIENVDKYPNANEIIPIDKLVPNQIDKTTNIENVDKYLNANEIIPIDKLVPNQIDKTTNIEKEPYDVSLVNDNIESNDDSKNESSDVIKDENNANIINDTNKDKEPIHNHIEDKKPVRIANIKKSRLKPVFS